MVVNLRPRNIFALAGGEETNNGEPVSRLVQFRTPESVILVGLLSLGILHLLLKAVQTCLRTLLEIAETHMSILSARHSLALEYSLGTPQH